MTDCIRMAVWPVETFKNSYKNPNWPQYGDLVEFTDRDHPEKRFMGYFVDYMEPGPTYVYWRRIMLVEDDVFAPNKNVVLTVTPEEMVRIVTRRDDMIVRLCNERTMEEASEFIHRLGVNGELHEEMLLRMIKCFRNKVKPK